MTSKFYGKMWIATCDDLKNIIICEKLTRLCKQEQNPRIAHTTYASLYAKYVFVVNALGDIYDQTLQVQKREVVKEILTLATKRLFELQLDLVKIEMSEFIYIDQTLIEQKFIPHEVTLLTPFYYPKQRKDEINDLLNGVRHFKEDATETETVPENQKKSLKYLMEMSKAISPEEQRKLDERKALTVAINLIIAHEKARQARNLLYNIKAHPKLYVIESLPTVHAEPVYNFTHKEDVVALFPVKRTDYRISFYKVKRDFDDEGNEVILDTSNGKENVTLFSAKVANDVAIDFITRFMKNLRRNESAVVIQRCYLRYRLRKAIKQEYYEHLHNIGMLELRRPDNSNEYELIKEMREKRRNKKAEFDKAFVKACEDDKARILRLRTPYIMEDISDHVRYWFREMYEAAGDFDIYPPEMKGGSILIVKGETKTAKEFADYIKKRKTMSPEKIKQEASKERKVAAELKKKLKVAKRKQKQIDKKMRAEWKKQTNQWNFDDARFITTNALKLESKFNEYQKEWKFVDELANPSESPYMDSIQENNYADVHQALRLEVDKLLRVELELLKMALCKDQGKKYKAPIERKLKDKQKIKKKNKKGIKTMSMDKIEKLYDYFVENKILIPCPKVNLDDFIGDLNYGAYEMRTENKTPPHNLGEVKYLLRQWVFGLGDISVPKVRSICIAGPPGCGKKSLAFGLIQELGAVVFNISPDVVVKFADEMTKFMDKLTTLTRILSPSVVFINNAHYPFIKKVPPNIADQNPKLLGKYLPKFIKAIKANDNVIVFGTSNQPMLANLKKMKKTFTKIAVCYGPDYSSTLLAWQRILPPAGVDPEFDYSSLAKVTKFFQMKQILDLPEKVLNLERRAHLQQRPLKPEEMLQALLTGDPPNFAMNEKELNKLINFANKVNKFVRKAPPAKKK